MNFSKIISGTFHFVFKIFLYLHYKIKQKTKIMIKINDYSRLLTGKLEKRINAPDGVDFEIEGVTYNVKEMEDGIVIRKLSLKAIEVITIQASSPNQITLK